MLDLVYYSTASGNTARLVDKLVHALPGLSAHRIPRRREEEHLRARAPYILISPTYGAGDGQGAVPRPVIKFLNDPDNRSFLRGVISTGNMNFGESFCISGDIIAHKTGVPHLARVEVFGTPEDVERVVEILRA